MKRGGWWGQTIEWAEELTLCSPSAHCAAVCATVVATVDGCASAQPQSTSGTSTSRQARQGKTRQDRPTDPRSPFPRQTGEQLAQRDWVAGRPRIDERFREARICNSVKGYCTSMAGSVAYLDKRCVESGGAGGDEAGRSKISREAQVAKRERKKRIWGPNKQTSAT